MGQALLPCLPASFNHMRRCSVQNGLTTASIEPLFQRLLVQIIGEAGILPLIPSSGETTSVHVGNTQSPTMLIVMACLQSQTIFLLR